MDTQQNHANEGSHITITPQNKPYPLNNTQTQHENKKTCGDWAATLMSNANIYTYRDTKTLAKNLIDLAEALQAEAKQRDYFD